MCEKGLYTKSKKATNLQTSKPRTKGRQVRQKGSKLKEDSLCGRGIKVIFNTAKTVKR